MGMLKKIAQEIWHSLYNYPRFIYCLLRLLRMPEPKVTVFGGKRAQPHTKFYDIAFACGKLLAQKNYSVLSGGGPGIMEAVLCGVLETGAAKNRAMGIGVVGIDTEFTSKCGYDVIYLPDFASRKWLLIHYSKGFIVLPGGFGTLDEAAQVVNLIKTHKMEKVPIILIGKEFWQPIIDWIGQSMQQGLIQQEFKELVISTDDIQQAMNIIEAYVKLHKSGQ